MICTIELEWLHGVGRNQIIDSYQLHSFFSDGKVLADNGNRIQIKDISIEYRNFNCNPNPNDWHVEPYQYAVN